MRNQSASVLAHNEIDYILEAKKKQKVEKAHREKTLKKLKATMVPNPMSETE